MSIKLKHNPHDVCRITCGFGPRKSPTSGASTNHQGIDIGAKKSGVVGDPLYSVDDGTVEISKIDSNDPKVKKGYGYYIQVKHNGYSALYGHLQKLEVKVGQKVKAGQIIAHMGNTGTSTAAHLHFGIKTTKWIDPKPLLLTGKEEEEVTQDQFNAMMETYLTQRKAKPVSGWAAQHWSEATKKDYVDGKAPQGLITREEVATIFNKVIK